MGDSSKLTFLGSPRMNAATPVEKAVLCGLSEKEAKRFERLTRNLELNNDDCIAFLVHCVQKLIEKHRPKYTYEDIVELHSHLS